jgi:triosephosphate isomerase (TIM)
LKFKTTEENMTRPIKPLIAGNWKMNGLKSSGAELNAMIEGAKNGLGKSVDLLICPPSTLIMGLARVAEGSKINIGAQDCHAQPSGAHTGDISADMIADAGGVAVIVGHSERRADHAESDARVREKAAAAMRAGLLAIVCIGETEAQKNAGQTIDVVLTQLGGSIPDNTDSSLLVIAYEPVWAIGTGRTPTVADVEQVHTAIRNGLIARFGDAGETVRILYGGSVKPSNAAELLHVANVNGALIGGASLKASDFLAIAAAAVSL